MDKTYKVIVEDAIKDILILPDLATAQAVVERKYPGESGLRIVEAGYRIEFEGEATLVFYVDPECSGCHGTGNGTVNAARNGDCFCIEEMFSDVEEANCFNYDAVKEFVVRSTTPEQVVAQ